MTKSIIAIATAILAATTMLTSAAEAGFKVHLGFGGVPPYLTDYNKQSAYEHKRANKRAYRAARRHDKAPVKVTKKSSSSESVAKVEEKPQVVPAKVAEIENSSISVAQADVAETAAAEPVETTATTGKPQTVSAIDCKKFFPAVGMTLTVPCE